MAALPYHSYPQAILHVLDTFPRIAVRERTEKGRILTYCMYLLTFLGVMSSKRGISRVKVDEQLSELPEAVKIKMLEKFTVTTEQDSEEQ